MSLKYVRAWLEIRSIKPKLQNPLSSKPKHNKWNWAGKTCHQWEFPTGAIIKPINMELEKIRATKNCIVKAFSMMNSLS